jgi:short-subunit dehydrogenase
VNCAGFMDVRSVVGMPWERVQALLTVDLLAPLRLQQVCAAGMVARGRGHIVNVSSMAGRVPIKGCAYYGAAKAGLAMASEVARAELAPRGVRVVTVYPGPVASGLEQGARAQYPRSLAARAIPTGDPHEVALRILDALERGAARVVYPRAYALGYRAPDLASAFTLGFGPDPRE